MAEQQDDNKEWSDTIRGDQQAGIRPEALLPAPVRPSPRAARKQDSRYPLVLAIALGVAGLVLVWIVGVTFVQWRAQVATQEKMRMSAEAQRQSQLQAEQLQREAAERQVQLQAEQQKQEEQRIQAFKEQQKAMEAARQADTDAAERKEKAWAKFYRPPQHCETAATMDCTNRYIRAKREFEERYAKGQL